MKPTDELLNTIAANHGIELPANAKMAPASKAKRNKREDEEDDAQASQQGGGPDDAMTDAEGAAGMGETSPIQLAQAEAALPAAGEAGAGASGAAGAAGAAAEGAGIGLGTLALGGLAIGGIALAASGGGGNSAPPVASDTTAPTVSSVAITSATGILNSTLNTGDVVSVTVTMSEATTVAGSPQLALDIGGTTVQASYASGSGGTALIFTYTIQAGQTDASGISIAANSLSLNGGTLKDAAGNNAAITHVIVADNVDYMVDTAAPAFSSGATASVAENTATSVTVYDATADGDSGVTYTLSGTDNALFNIDAGTGAVTFIASPDYETPADAGGNNIYDFTVTATDAAGNATDQAVALTVTNVGEAGDAVIDLGTSGKLINGVQVEGNWYYYWDRSGDGTNGVVDRTTHDVLDGLFTQDIAGIANPGIDTTDTYRYATLNGVHLALPTANGGTAYPNGINANQPGTAYTDAGATSNGTTSSYNELLAIWDAYNGTGTGTNINGTPSGWQAYGYWSATPSASGHAYVYLYYGFVLDDYDTVNNYVALQVL